MCHCIGGPTRFTDIVCHIDYPVIRAKRESQIRPAGIVRTGRVDKPMARLCHAALAIRVTAVAFPGELFDAMPTYFQQTCSEFPNQWVVTSVRVHGVQMVNEL
jgi:hypothetical protein